MRPNPAPGCLASGLMIWYTKIMEMMQNILVWWDIGKEEDYEPPPNDDPLPGGRLRGMVSRVAAYVSVRPRGEDPSRLHCLYRKSLGVVGTVEFHPD